MALNSRLRTNGANALCTNNCLAAPTQGMYFPTGRGVEALSLEWRSPNLRVPPQPDWGGGNRSEEIGRLALLLHAQSHTTSRIPHTHGKETKFRPRGEVGSQNAALNATLSYIRSLGGKAPAKIISYIVPAFIRIQSFSTRPSAGGASEDGRI